MMNRESRLRRRGETSLLLPASCFLPSPMRLSLSWLREFIRLPASPAEVARLLTEHAFETIVSGSSPTLNLRNIRVGEVLDVAKHPNASRLTVVTVRVGGETRRIVCGGPNVRTGTRVAVALPGSEVIGADGARTIIHETTIRDVQSAGMLCSERELGLGTEHEGSIELPPDAPVGDSLASVFPEDTILDAAVLPDRAADCSSHVGVARELGAILRRRARVPWPSLPRVRGTPSFRVRVEDSRLCSRYIAIVLDGVRLEPSPGWIQRRLRALGVQIGRAHV